MALLPLHFLVLSFLGANPSAGTSFDFSRAAPGAPPAPFKVFEGSWRVEGGSLVGEPGPNGEAHILLCGRRRAALALDVEFSFSSVKDPTRWFALCFGAGPQGGPPYHVFTVRFAAGRSSGIEYAFRRPDRRWEVRARGSFSEKILIGMPLKAEIRVAGGRIAAFLNGRKALTSPFVLGVGKGYVGLHLSGSKVKVMRFAARDLTPEEQRALGGPIRGASRPVCIAHRGFSFVAPENTLASLREAVEIGADGAEFDVYLTRDRHLVLMHDNTVTRTTDFRKVFGPKRSANVWDLDLEDLRRLDAGSRKGAKWRGERIPTLEEALRLLRGKAVPVIEIKPAEIGAEVAAVVKKLGMEKEVFVQSFKPEAVHSFHEKCPGAATGYLVGGDASGDPKVRAHQHAEAARRAGANTVVVYWGALDAAYIFELHRLGLAVWTWTVDDPSFMKRLGEIGIDGIITNRPDLFREVFSGAPR